MNELPEDILRIMTQYLPRVVTCLYFELAMGKKINSKEYYVKRFENEPISNTFRFFKKGQLRTYTIYSFIRDGVTYSDVSVSPICRTFQCIHKKLITPSKANHWVITCMTDGDNSCGGYIRGIL